MTAAQPNLGLYGAPNSPFSLRVSLAAQAKGISLAALPLPDGGLRSAAFLAINPAAKIPVLITETGLSISESAVILEYLEDRFPVPALLPADPDERAFMRTVIAMTDRYFMAPVIRLFPQLAPATRVAAVCEAEIARWHAGLGILAQLLERPLAPVEAQLSMADCVLGPSFHLGSRIAAMLGLPDDPVSGFPTLLAICDRLSANERLAAALRDLTARQEAKDIAAGLPSVAARHRWLTG